jgi:hypothetical protein
MLWWLASGCRQVDHDLAARAAEFANLPGIDAGEAGG